MAESTENSTEKPTEKPTEKLIESGSDSSLIYTNRGGEDSYFSGARRDLLAMIPANATRILDVGCGAGRLGEALKQERARDVTGIELHQASAAIAATLLDKVICASVTEAPLAEVGAPASFDCIIFGDILEHLLDPWETLRRYRTLLAPDGVVVASLPNIGHITVILGLLAGRWEYRDRGVLDQTHLRFFTYRSLQQLFEQAGLEIVRRDANYRLLDRSNLRYSRLARMLGKGPLRTFFAYQYVVVARPRQVA